MTGVLIATLIDALPLVVALLGDQATAARFLLVWGVFGVSVRLVQIGTKLGGK